MKKLLLGLLLSLSISPALAQNTTCPTRPFGDNSNACASTAFVQNAFTGLFGNPTASVGITAVNGVATTAMRSDAAPALVKGVNANVLNSQTGNYTILNTDCGKTVQMGTGSSGFNTLTVPAVAGFDTTCSIVVSNGDSTRLKTISGLTGITLLFPTQSFVLRIVNGAWAYDNKPPRQKLTATTQYYYDPTAGAGGDGTVVGSPVTNPNTILDYLYKYVDTQGQVVIINAAAGTYSGEIVINSPFLGDGCNVFVIGAGNTSIVDSTSGSAAIAATNYGCINVRSMRLKSTGRVSQGIQAVDHAQIFYQTIDFAGNAADIYSDREGYIEATGDWSISSSPLNEHLHVSHQGGFRALGRTINVTADLTMTYFAKVYALGDLTFQTGTITLNAHTVTAQRFYVSSGGAIYTAGAGLTFFPGTTAGVVDSGGFYDELYLGARTAYFQGSSSGNTTLVATAAASGALILPAATDTLVGKATTDELTNKTLTASVGKGTWTAGGTWTLPSLTLSGVTTMSGSNGVLTLSTDNAFIQWGATKAYLQGNATTFTFQFGTDSGAGPVNRLTITTGIMVGNIIDPGANNLATAGYVRVGVTTVGALPACGANQKGAHLFVTDSNAASYTAGIGAIVAAGGATNVPVTCDGTNWRIGANDNIPFNRRRSVA